MKRSTFATSYSTSAVIEVFFLNALLAVGGVIGISAHGWKPMDWVWFLGLMGLGLGSGIYYVHKLNVAVSPIRDISRLATDIARGLIGNRLPVSRREDELGAVIRDVNAMLEQLEGCFSKQRLALDAASENRFNQPIDSGGLQGAFREAVEQGNRSLAILLDHYHNEMRNNLLSRLGQLNAENLLKNMRTNQQDMLGIVAATDELARLATENASAAQESSAAIVQVVGAMNRLMDKIEETNRAIAEFDGHREEIARSVDLIASIADQTNLLALNAAIEAARAGEHGRGFAVVADEVRKLAESSKNASAGIANIMQTLGSDAEKMLVNSREMGEIASESRQTVGDFDTRFAAVAESSATALKQSRFIHDVSFVSLAKIDHFIYKQNGYMAMNRGTQSDNATAIQVNETQCRLGKWLTKDETLANFGQVSGFRRVGEPHRQVHQNMHNALALMAQNWATDYAVQEEMFKAFQKVEAGSDNVIEALDDMVREKHGIC